MRAAGKAAQVSRHDWPTPNMQELPIAEGRGAPDAADHQEVVEPPVCLTLAEGRVGICTAGSFSESGPPLSLPPLGLSAFWAMPCAGSSVFMRMRCQSGLEPPTASSREERTFDHALGRVQVVHDRELHVSVAAPPLEAVLLHQVPGLLLSRHVRRQKHCQRALHPCDELRHRLSRGAGSSATLQIIQGSSCGAQCLHAASRTALVLPSG